MTMKSFHNKDRKAVRLCPLLPFLLMANMAEAQVTVDVRIDSLELWIGEQTRMTLDVSADAGSKIAMPHLEAGDMLVPGVEVVEVSSADTLQLNEGTRRQVSQSYVVTSFDSALYYLPPLVVEVDGKEYKSKNLALRVLSIPVDTVHVDRFYGPKEIMAVPFSWADWSLIFWLSVLLLVWVLGLAYFYIRYRDDKPIIKMIKLAPKILPHTKAMEEINQIKAGRVWAKEDPKEYYTRLTAILRTYMEKRYGFNALEMTSTEIIDRLLKEQTPESLRELRMLFQTADLVKFAKYKTLINENDANLVSAIEFINRTKAETDGKAESVPDEVTVEQKRSRRTLMGMRLALVSLALAALALSVWILWMVHGLVV